MNEETQNNGSSPKTSFKDDRILSTKFQLMKLDLTSLHKDLTVNPETPVGEPFVLKSDLPYRWVQFGRSMPEGKCHSDQFRDSDEEFLKLKFMVCMRSSFDKGKVISEEVKLK